MKSSRKIIAAIVTAGIMAIGAVAVAAPGADDCGGRSAMMRDGMHGANFDPAARVDQRLSRLKADLKITAEQEPLWQAFAEKAKSEAGKGFQAMQEQAKDTTLTAPERMTRMTDMMKQRVAAMESVNEAFNHLYQGVTPEQRKLADEHAAQMGHMGMEHMGHHGPSKHRGPPPADSTKG
jgi:periplasmic protein CpxP/Spy